MTNSGKNYSIQDAYHIVDSTTESLYVYNYSENSIRLFNSLKNKEFLSREDFRKMQAFTVQAYEHFIAQNASMCVFMPQGFKVWYGNYDSMVGISIEPLTADKYIV